MPKTIPGKYLSSSLDFRSDTFTIPTPQLWEQVSEASMGDSVYEEDTDTTLLEERIAHEFLGGQMFDGEAQGLFCMSTTMSNQLAIRSHLNLAPPFSVLCDKRAHVYVDECAGIAVLSQALVVPVEASNSHHLTLDDIKANYIPNDGDIHLAPTKLICLENTLHGMCFPYSELRKISEWCHHENIKLHLDGARLWNAATYHDEPDKFAYLHKIAPLFDSISMCLSKSIGAPVGSMLIGTPEFMKRARHLQKQQGGGIRQAGFIARIANYCIDYTYPAKIHQVSLKVQEFWHDLHQTMKDIHSFELFLAHPVETNFIFIDLAKSKINIDVLLKFGGLNGVRLFDGRLAFHYQNIDDSSLETLKKVFLDMAAHYKDHEYIPDAGKTRIY
ncbi:LAMI_0E07668g1_1 [Lachancea mirantina]|uniref:low-specificity L-threonine aldolase n=1 Tax=Lachancea mirantina TaxID=1230905 RepID=A0A1G4JMJ5_9SACH|nr:LAMI_0E07668g1_1 [Lachancea mirantina]